MSNSFYTIREDSLGYLWVASDQDLQKIDPNSKQFIDQIVTPIAGGLLSFDIDNNDNAWAPTYNKKGLLRVDLGTGIVTEYSNTNGDLSKEYYLTMGGIRNIHNGSIYLTTSASVDVPNPEIIKVDIASLIAGNGDGAITEYVVGAGLGSISVTTDGKIFVNDTSFVKIFDEGVVALQDFSIGVPGATMFLNAPTVSVVLLDGYYWVPGATFDGMSPPQFATCFVEYGDTSYTLLGSFEASISANSNVVVGTESAMNLGSSYNVVIGEGAASSGNLTGGMHTIVGSRAGPLLAGGRENILIGANAGSTLVSGSSNVLIGVNAGSSLASDASDILAISSPIGSSEPLIFGDFNLKHIIIGTGNTAIDPNMLAMGRYGTSDGFINTDEGGGNPLNRKLNLLTIGNGTDSNNRNTAFGILETGTQWRSPTQPSAAGVEDILLKQNSFPIGQGTSAVIDYTSSGPTASIFYDYLVGTGDRVRAGTITISYHSSGTFNSGDVNPGNLNGDPLLSLTVAYNTEYNRLELSATNTDPVEYSIVSIRKRTMH